jgi:hypothetical protein
MDGQCRLITDQLMALLHQHFGPKNIGFIEHEPFINHTYHLERAPKQDSMGHTKPHM